MRTRATRSAVGSTSYVLPTFIVLLGLSAAAPAAAQSFSQSFAEVQFGSDFDSQTSDTGADVFAEFVVDPENLVRARVGPTTHISSGAVHLGIEVRARAGFARSEATFRESWLCSGAPCGGGAGTVARIHLDGVIDPLAELNFSHSAGDWFFTLTMGPENAPRAVLYGPGGDMDVTNQIVFETNGSGQPTLLLNLTTPATFGSGWQEEVHARARIISGSSATAHVVDFFNSFSAEIVSLTPGAVWTSASGREASPDATDTTPPHSFAVLVPEPNAAGWFQTDVDVSLLSTDAETGVDHIEYSATGAQTIPPTVVLGNDVDNLVIRAEGVTIVTFFARNRAGLAESPQSLVIRIDKTAPLVAYSGNAGSYGVDQEVQIACSATDPANANGTAGSGLASSTCAGVSGPAYSFNLGANDVSASATDLADNSSSASASFSVEVAWGGLCVLTERFVESSARFQSLPPDVQHRLDQAVDRLCAFLSQTPPPTTPPRKALFIRLYQLGVAALAQQGWLTAEQAALLVRLSNQL